MAPEPCPFHSTSGEGPQFHKEPEPVAHGTSVLLPGFNSEMLSHPTLKHLEVRLPTLEYWLQHLKTDIVCTGSKLAMKKQSVWLACCSGLPSHQSNIDAVYAFVQKYLSEGPPHEGPAKDAKTFVPYSFTAVFPDFHPDNEQEQAVELLKLLVGLHKKDLQQGVAWNAQVSADVTSAEFGYSLHNHAFFVPTFGPHTYGPRKTACVGLAFNAHAMFKNMKELGIFDAFKHAIHANTVKAGFEIHPFLGDFGAVPEFVQYVLALDNDQSTVFAYLAQASAGDPQPFLT